jgi:hypothetical protein
MPFYQRLRHIAVRALREGLRETKSAPEGAGSGIKHPALYPDVFPVSYRD